MAELYGKVEGCSRGYGGSMHLYDVEHGLIGANAVVGGGLPAITGRRALVQAARRAQGRASRSSATARRTSARSTSRSTSPSSGRCRPSSSARTTATRSRRPPGSSCRSTDLSKRAVAFGMHTIVVDGQDVEAVLRGCPGARLVRARRGEGPRVPAGEHVPADRPLRRRPAGLPGPRGGPRGCARRRIRSTSCAEASRSSDDDWAELERRSSSIVEASVEFAQNGTDPRPEDALKNIYAED